MYVCTYVCVCVILPCSICLGWLCFTSHRQRRHLDLANDVKLVSYTVPTGNRTPDRRMAVHDTAAVPRQLH